MVQILHNRVIHDAQQKLTLYRLIYPKYLALLSDRISVVYF